MERFDLYFHYKHVGRNIMLNKYSFDYLNSYGILSFKKVLVYFSIKDLENLDDFCIANYYFFMFFFFGYRSFFFNYSSTFNLGVTYYSFFIQCFFNNRYVFFFLNFMINDLLELNLEKLQENFKVKDISIITEKRALTGFFNIRHTLDIKFFYSNSWKNRNILLSLFKLKI